MFDNLDRENPATRHTASPVIPPAARFARKLFAVSIVTPASRTVSPREKVKKTPFQGESGGKKEGAG
jgi:hypothetical protein